MTVEVFEKSYIYTGSFETNEREIREIFSSLYRDPEILKTVCVTVLAFEQYFCVFAIFSHNLTSTTRRSFFLNSILLGGRGE